MHPFRIELDRDHHIVGDHLAGAEPGYLFLHGLGSVRAGEKSDSLLAHARNRGVAFTRCDFRGHGESTGTIGQVTISELIDDTMLLLERFGPAVVVGSSLGGLVGAFAASRRAGLVPGIALIAPAFGFLPRLESNIEEHGQSWTIGDRSFPLAQRVIDDARQLDERSLPRALCMPTYIVHGDADDVVPAAQSQRFFQAIPHSRKDLWIVPGGDHRLNAVKEQVWPEIDRLMAGSG